MAATSLELLKSKLLRLELKRKSTNFGKSQKSASATFYTLVITSFISFLVSWSHKKGGRKIFCVYGKNSSLIRNRYV